MDLMIQAKVLEHVYRVIMQKPFEQGVPFKPAKAPYTSGVIKQRLPRKAPGDVGISAGHLNRFVEELQLTSNLNVHQFMVIKDSAVICEGAFAPYRQDIWHVTHSLCKTVTSMAIGILIGDGLLNLEDKLVKVFDSKVPPLSKFRLGKITVRHLLTMSTGAVVDESLLCAEMDWLKAYFDTGLHFEPGTKFKYNSMNSYVLSCMVQEITGITMFEFLKERLFAPMGIETVHWESCPMGRTKGGWGMYLMPEDMAKLGLLLLHGGSWKGKSLVPQDYVTEMTRKQIDSAPEENMYGYGFQTWMGKLEGSFLFNGMLGQNVHVIPSRNMVVVITGGNDMLFGDCPVNHIVYKYFTDAPLPAPEAQQANKGGSIKPKNLKSEFGWWQEPRADGFLDYTVSAIKRFDKNKVVRQVMELAGKSCVFEKPGVRFQPLFAQFINNCYTPGVERLSFSLEDDRFYMTVKEGEEENKIALGFKAPEYSPVAFKGEPYLVAAHAVFAADEDGVPVLKITVPFVEHSNGRIIKIFFKPENKVRVEWKEFPGSAILTDGATNFMGGMSPTVLGQVKAHVDLEMILAMADGLMEPVSNGILE